MVSCLNYSPLLSLYICYTSIFSYTAYNLRSNFSRLIYFKFDLITTISVSLIVFLWGCQGGAVEKGLSCQSRCQRIESGLRQTDKKLSAGFQPKNAGSFGSRPKLGGPVYHNNIVGTLKIHLCPSHIGQVLRLLNEHFTCSLGECYVCPFLGSHNTYLIGQPAFCTLG